MAHAILFAADLGLAILVTAGLERLVHLIGRPQSGGGGEPGGDPAWRYRLLPRRPGPHGDRAARGRSGSTVRGR